MFDFIFHNPTKIIFGRGRETQIGEELGRAGMKRVLFLYGKNSIKQSGLFDRITESLRHNDIDYIEFGGVTPNPLLAHTRQGIELARQKGVEAVLAVGGGSVLDEAKAIAVGALSGCDVWEHFIGKEITAALPVFTVLTLAATGSEMNGNSVITNDAKQQKYSITSDLIYPRVSILNPELTCSVPPAHSANGAVDAIAHVIETYFTKQADAPLQERLVESIILTVIDTTEVIMREPDNYPARAEFMWTATLALNGLTTAGVGGYGFPNHMIEHSLSAMYGIAHGAGLAIVIPAWMKWYRDREPARFDRFARQIFRLDSGLAGIEALEKWFAGLQAPTRLQDAGIPAGDINKIAENAHGLARLWDLGDTYTEQAIAEILTLAV